jgi:D-alanyl-lipoteichoic acid acyltransferase DltB (MBOAT superfamily)
MFFDTPIYVVFLTLITLVYWRLNWRTQNKFLLVASYFFYGWWDWRFLSLILISTIVDFYCALAIAASQNAVHRKALLSISVCLNLGFLGFFKYCDFFIGSFRDVLATLGISASLPILGILLPPGISFYTFQAVAYIIDVYSGKLEPSRSLLDYALFISLFPHLIAGPIQRPAHLLPQVQKPRTWNADHFFDGLMLIASGMFRKCVIANSCALIADACFFGKDGATPRLGEPSLAVTLIGAYAFAWQIYGDFSGYSDIARGSAQLIGFHFMVNFRRPYFAETLQDFWRRWHISLSTFLRDYLYIGLGGNRHGEWKTYRNLLLTMVIGGFWHGANWTFIIWGAIHGGVLAIERFMLGLFGVREKSGEGARLFNLSAWFHRIVVFHIVCLAWIFFRAQSVREAFAMLEAVGDLSLSADQATAFGYVAAVALVLFVLDLIGEYRSEEYFFQRSSYAIRTAAAFGLVVATTFFTGASSSAFIYFQF